MYEMMNDCERIGISGGCGYDCPVFQDSECEYSMEYFDNIDIENEIDEEVLELYEYYVVKEKAKHIRWEKEKQIESLNFTSPHNIKAHDLLEYSNNKFKFAGITGNLKFIKILIENDKFDDKLLSLLLEKYKRTSSVGSKPTEYDAFKIFMYLMGQYKIENIDVDLFREVISGKLSFARFKKDFIDLFYESDGTELIERLNVNFDSFLTEKKKLESERVLAEIVIQHKNIDDSIRIDIYNKTLDDKYLPHNAVDIFIF